MKILKEVLGVDISQKELEVTLGRLNEDLTIELYAHRVFSNKETGFVALEKWLRKNTDSTVSTRIVMEATGVYHQKFAYFMLDKNFNVSIVLPNKISNYLKTLDVKTITDKTCSEAITRFGLERNLEDWKKPDDTYRVLQQLTRERDQIVYDRTVAKNRLHAEEREVFPNTNSVKRLKSLIKFLNKQERDIKNEINAVLKQNKAVKEGVDRMITIPGMGQLTAVIILAETNGFELVRNKKQLTSYAGLDVREKLSGTSVKGKPRISKKGNRHIRKSLHLPALAAIKYNPIHKAIYSRLVSHHGIKMKSLVAIQRKMLELSFILFKNKTEFDAEYETKKESCTNGKLPLKLAQGRFEMQR
jgi:transposase